TGDIVDTNTGAVTHTVTGDTTSTLTGTLTKTVTGDVAVNAATSITVTTPSWTLNNTGPSSFWQASYMTETPARLSVVGASADAWGVRGQAYGVNLQWAVLKLDYYDFKNEGGQIKITQKVVKLAGTAAAEIRTGGAHVVSKVVSLFT